MPDAIERRQCPCTHLVELRGEVHADYELLKQSMAHCKDSSKGRMEGIVKDFQESNLAIKECLLNMQKSSLMFIEGNQKFVEMTRLLAEGKRAQATHTRWLLYLSFVCGCLVAVSFFNGHAATVLDALATLLKLK